MRPASTGAGTCAVLAVMALASAAWMGAVEANATSSPTPSSCTRGTFKDYHDQGEANVPPASYDGPVFRLSQDYPDTEPPAEDVPWQTVDVARLRDPAQRAAASREYLASMFAYVTEGNIEADFVPQDNPVRDWFHAPWMDATADGREFVHGLTHELDSPPGLLGPGQTTTTQTWAVAAYNAPGGWAFGQVWCDPEAPNPAALNKDDSSLNSFPNGTAVWKLLFSTATSEQLPFLDGTVEWDADIDTTQGDPSPDPARSIQTVRLIQMDVAVRDDRLPNGWAFATYAYSKDAPGDTPWARLLPVGLMWGNDPTVTPEAQASGTELQETWINPDGERYGLGDDHLGWGGRLNGPLDDPNSSCMSCHQTAGVPAAPLVPPSSAGSKASLRETMQWFVNVPAGSAFGDPARVSLDYSLQASIGVQRFYLATCDEHVVAEQNSARSAARPAPAMLARESCAELASLFDPVAVNSPESPARAWLWAAVIALSALLAVALAANIRRARGARQIAHVAHVPNPTSEETP